MANQPLVGAAPIAVNDIPVVSATKVTYKRARNIVIKKGAFGTIGVGKGQPSYSGTVTFAVPKMGMEVDLQDWFNSETGYSLTFQRGVERWKATGVFLTEDDFNSDLDPGNTETTLNWVAADMIRVQ
jgi:hypothetical protein